MIVAFFDMSFYLSDPSGLHLMFNFPLCKLYSNSVMSSLNSRRGWKFGNSAGGESQGQAASGGNVTLKNRHMQITTGKNNDILSGLDHQTNPAAVYVHVESHELRDRAGASSSWDDEKVDPALPQSQWSAV
ncbi:hypothetical protein CPB83DRAFT_861476 [Crepidotus variabilis]|uniref:Uncharacterized protein n=1 Tax=Crepidotus variabilis TaxID=179855 RepID=A0A9P6E831_9AGAR|nr:hypothetical protein CPB83DRAFT_861476 [Crepidotus variabilis]